MLLFPRRRPAPVPYPTGSPEDLAARWLRWVAGQDWATSPVADLNGEHAGRDQPDDVWFLAGTFGGPVQRDCTVPAGRPLYGPAVNMWGPAGDGPPVLGDGFGRITVDGADVELREVVVDAVDLAGSQDNPVTQTRRIVPMAMWGLWGLVPPLPAGRHEVVIRGGDGHGFTVEAVYTLDVAAG
ncbi:hypothetical protein J1G42_15215 [Cellulomonas sp. zg-ZUI222]|uniref:hypothetical protein n=1 Tax=Cellulomonas wangleii TaxID=2816956 RepID=UPI001A953CE6|nr:hypothetical protein [Cellulomonas wangleii]MBO0922173.1 hypothetical protein [Cellulomonas wangleii]